MTPQRRAGCRWPLLFAAAWAACDHREATTTRPAQAPAPPSEFFDFGTIAHGKAGQHDFVLDVHKVLGPGYFTVGTHVDCSCARALVFLRDADGRERAIENFNPAFAPAPGEVVVVRLLVDTLRKEPVDVGPIDSHASVVFQPMVARDASTRVLWPLTFRFAVDSPVRLRPNAVLDFERVHASATPELVTTIASDVPGRPIAFGPVHCDDDRLHFQLERKGDLVLLRSRLQPRPGEYGALRALVTIDTDYDGYVLPLAATAILVPDLEAMPNAKLSIRADLRRAQDVDRAQSQYLIVTDHDRSKPAEFRVARLVDEAGNDARANFEVTFEPLVGEDRSRRMRLRWIGHAEREFRGELVLAKDPEHGPFLPIEIVALHYPQP